MSRNGCLSLAGLTIAVVLAIGTCNGDTPNSDSNSSSDANSRSASNSSSSSQGGILAYERFKTEFRDEGVGCPRLFELRNAAKTHAQPGQLEDMHNKLISVRCFSAQSGRTKAATTNDGGFTLKEYRIHRYVIDTPMGVPEELAVRVAAEEYGVSVTAAQKALHKVLRILHTHNWLGRAEDEIRHATDWKGEKR